MKPETIKALHQFLLEQQRVNVQTIQCIIDVVKLFPPGEARQPVIESTDELVKRITNAQPTWVEIQNQLLKEIGIEP